jgi:phage terminase large subunit GpA-like protein
MISFALQEQLRSSLIPTATPSVLEWARDNVVLPDGPLRGTAFDPSVQPFARLFLDELDSGRWDRFVIVAPSQSGKTLLGFIMPTLFHLLGMDETVVVGVPDLAMANDKWLQDFLPVIEASPELKRMLPTIGPGSRSGIVRSRVRFKNGAVLRFMSSGGKDKSRAGFTSRVLAITEADGFQTSGTSIEADPIKQLEARQRAFLAAGTRTYLECTASTTEGRIWTEYNAGSASRIARPCPHCGEFVTPEREHLVGWEGADDELQARANASWSCPSCGECWTEAERYAANLQSVLVHKGQSVDAAGDVTGAMPATRTLGFRWSAVDNHFANAADVAADEWHGRRDLDSDNSEKQLRQFVYALPFDPPAVEVMTPLCAADVAKRSSLLKEGIAPDDCVALTIGIDTGKRQLNWVAIAWLADGSGRIVEYGEQTVRADTLGIRAGLVEALELLREYFGRGWQTPSGKVMQAAQVWIDSGWYEHTEAVYDFCQAVSSSSNYPAPDERPSAQELAARSAGRAQSPAGQNSGRDVYRPSKGYGEGQRRMERYWVPKKINSDIRWIGAGCHLARAPGRSRLLLAHINSDTWKSELHQRLAMEAEKPGALTLYAAADSAEHEEFINQLTAEKQITKWVDGRGDVIVWHRDRSANHKLDAGYAAVAAGHMVLSLKMKPLTTHRVPPQNERLSLNEMARLSQKGR